MYILGISCHYHDAAAALLADGLLVAAAEEERFSRKKHDQRFPDLAIDFCLQQAGIKVQDVDYVVFYEKPLVKFERILLTSLGTFPHSWHSFREAMISWFNEKLWIKSQLMRKFSAPAERVLFVDHHLAHAASAFFCSPFNESAILTIDGVGEWTTATLGAATAHWNGQGVNAIRLSDEIRFPHSLGLLYSAFTAFLGFEVNEGEYKVMGMAPYGQPRFQDKIYQLIDVAHDGSFHLNMDYFCYQHSTSQTFNRKFTDLFGEPRNPQAEFITRQTHADISGYEREGERNQYYADVAASIQRVTEDTLVKMANHLHQQTGSKHLCMAGGVALNGLANARILRETPFEQLFIQPAAGDSGGALGAALYAWHVLLGKPRTFVMEHAYWGRGYAEHEVHDFLSKAGIAYQNLPDDLVCERVVDALSQGKVVGWFQDRFEWGPRALGNRSILADPRRAEMKQIVNQKIKFREPFRPFAPVVLAEQADAMFDGVSNLSEHYPARFMLMILPWRSEVGAQVQAVNHCGTGRLQTLRREWNPRYHQLVAQFGQATGVPVLLNTSFNLRGEPIVSSPADAWNTFSKSGIDLLVMGNCLIQKEDK